MVEEVIAGAEQVLGSHARFEQYLRDEMSGEDD